MNSLQATAIVEKIAERTGVAFFDIVSDDRHRTIVRARQQAYIALHEAGVSYAQTGRLMQRHHTTVMDGIKVALLRRAAMAA